MITLDSPKEEIDKASVADILELCLDLLRRNEEIPDYVIVMALVKMQTPKTHTSCKHLKYDDPDSKYNFCRSCHNENLKSNAGENCKEVGGCHIKFPEEETHCAYWQAR